MVLFGGRGKISSLMGDFAQGIKAFKKGMSEDEKTAEPRPSRQDDRSRRQRIEDRSRASRRERALLIAALVRAEAPRPAVAAASARWRFGVD